MALLRLDKLQKRERILAWLLGVVLILAVGNYLVASPVRRKIWSLDEEIRAAENQWKGSAQILAISNEVAEGYVRIRQFEQRVPTNINPAAEMMTEIEKLASQSQLRVLSRRQQAVTSSRFYAEYSVAVEVQGSIEDTMTFLYRLHVSPQVLRVRKLDLAPDAREADKKKARLLVTRFVQV